MKIDVVVYSHNCNPVLLESYSELKKWGIHVIAWNHEHFFLPYWSQSLHNCLSSRITAMSHADVSLWLTNYSANCYSQLNDNGAAIPNLVAFSPKATCKPILQRDKIILSAGRFDDPRKGLDRLLEAFAIVRTEEPEAKLVVAGSFDLELQCQGKPNFTYATLIQDLNIPKSSIQFISWTPEMEELYQEAQIHVLPSYYEGFGLVITEAAAFGVPSVVFDGSGYEDIINHGVNGYIVPKDDIDEMARKIIDLLHNHILLQKFSKECEIICRKFDQDTIMQQWIRLIQAILTMPKESVMRLLKTEYRKPINDYDAFTKTAFREYENCVGVICDKLYTPVTSFDETIQSLDYMERVPYEWAFEELQRVYQSRSWRITRPLRLISRTLWCLRHEGIRSTMHKVINKLLRS